MAYQDLADRDTLWNQWVNLLSKSKVFLVLKWVLTLWLLLLRFSFHVRDRCVRGVMRLSIFYFDLHGVLGDTLILREEFLLRMAKMCRHYMSKPLYNCN